MKKLLLLFLPIMLMSAKCKKDDIEVDELPPITQTGANTFGARVNGKVFLPKAEFGTSLPKFDVNYNTFTQTMRLQAYNSVFHTGFNFIIANMSLKPGDNYPLVKYNVDQANASMAQYFISKDTGGDYEIVSPLIGTIQILKFDQTNKIFSGTFSFEAVNSLGEKVSITDGRFDLKYL